MQHYAYILLAVGWFAWALPFAFAFFAQKSPRAQKIDRRARLGMVLQGVGYSILWQSKFWQTRVTDWRLALSILFFALAPLLSWTASRALGKQWRFDAGLNPDHALVRAGPYRFLRHPIYTSMLCVLLATGFLATPYPLFALAALVFLAGTEIRSGIEDRLLLSRFGDEFLAYQRHAGAYIPFVKRHR